MGNRDQTLPAEESSFHIHDLIYPALVATAGELHFQECAHNAFCHLQADHPAPQCKDVCIVVFASIARGEFVRATGPAYARDLVDHHA